MRTALFAAILFILICGLVTPLDAIPVTYHYLGRPYAEVWVYPDEDDPLLFTTSDFLSATVVLDISPGIASSDLAPSYWRLRSTSLEGIYEIRPDETCDGLCEVISESSFDVDAQGTIINWSFWAVHIGYMY